MKKTNARRFFKFVSAIVLTTFVGRLAGAEVVVRDVVTSENEFQSLAQALGHMPVSEFLTTEKSVSNESGEFFRQRLIEAQSEWLRDGGKSWLAIDRFLDLVLEADWAHDEREAFAIFYARKFLIKGDANILRRLAALGPLGEDPTLAEFTASQRRDFVEKVEMERRHHVTFESNLPSDVVAIKLNGRVISRSELAMLKLPRVPARVTLISNAFQPLTLKLKGDEKDWPKLDRYAWIREDCVIAPLAPAFGAVKMQTLGLDRCKDQATDGYGKIMASIPPQERDLNERFGISKIPNDPLRLPESKSSAVWKKPWVWGAALGVIALGAVLAIRAGDRQGETVRATVQENWQ